MDSSPMNVIYGVERSPKFGRGRWRLVADSDYDSTHMEKKEADVVRNIMAENYALEEFRVTKYFPK